ncbi:hypothetical protein BDF14DRAFT_1880374 [Spinellus fusiger]|nr:hypothetical protein BDF14DRAFT_1880374 [Spinellus fusiger]
MYKVHVTKRFPAQCRYYSQGSCRAGEECVFSHVLPLKGPQETEGVADDMAHSLQCAIRDLELEQLENKYRRYYKSTHVSPAATRIELVIPSNHPLLVRFSLLIPNDYPDAHCTLHLNSTIPEKVQSHLQHSFEENAWQHNRHSTLVQQLDWFCAHHSSLLL